MQNAVINYRNSCKQSLTATYKSFTGCCTGIEDEHFITQFSKHYTDLSLELHQLSIPVLNEFMSRDPEWLVNTMRRVKQDTLDKFKDMVFETEPIR